MKKVLIVDDDRATSAGMADVVEEWGYDAEVADTVKAGWNSVSKMVPDVAIVDLKLPDGSGLDLLHRIKETYPHVCRRQADDEAGDPRASPSAAEDGRARASGRQIAADAEALRRDRDGREHRRERLHRRGVGLG